MASHLRIIHFSARLDVFFFVVVEAFNFDHECYMNFDVFAVWIIQQARTYLCTLLDNLMLNKKKED